MNHSVLVVEDDDNIVLSLTFLLEKSGFKTRVVGDGNAALNEMRKAKPDVVLLDVMLPERDGFSVCEEIRANSAWSDVHVIMLTAKGRDADREKGLAAGADEFITKPFSTRDLVAKVKAAIGMAAG
ncbi:MAG: two-component system response regulator [Rhodospirillales bacterium CG15_BIG_FIL_POST_REV_8_21_14_020_66_15]|nr:MAG: two-component system response regulator [Rhodospirillales bacterium CG15_BIG_FIL_POST_REV_8_21_14_020_66_15]